MSITIAQVTSHMYHLTLENKLETSIIARQQHLSKQNMILTLKRTLHMLQHLLSRHGIKHTNLKEHAVY